MSFLHLWMVWFLPLALLPLLLHLLTLHRLRTVELPTFRFLFDSYVQQRRRMQFLEALLAMLRTLFLLFLIFMVCRPVVKHWDSLFGSSTGSAGREVILLLDCSASMNAKSAGVSAFSRAKTTALSIVSRLRASDQVTLVRVGARPEEVFSRFNTDTKGIQARIEAQQPTSARANLFAALLHVFGPEAPSRASPSVYLFTDCQANTWKEARNQGLEKLVPEGTAFTVVNVGPREPIVNLAVLGDAPRQNRAIVGLPFLLTPRVINQGKTEAELTLSVFIDEKEVARTPLTVKAGEVVVKPIIYTPSEPGMRRGRFEITGKVPDGFPDDDRFLFTLSVQPKVKVVLINGNVADDPLQDEAHHLYTALTSKADPTEDQKKQPGAARTREIQRSLDVIEIPQAGLTADTLRDASVVVLANCGGLTDQQFIWLRAFVREGGGLLIFPGDRVSDITYNTRFFPVPGPQGEQITAAKLLPPTGNPEDARTFASLELDVGHPVLSVFDDKDAGHFRTVRISRHFGMELPKKRGNAWPLAYYEGTKVPALVESKWGDGTVLLAGFPAHPRWGNLPTKPVFVALMLRLASYAQHRPEAEVAPVVVADGTAEVSVNATWEPAEASVKDPDGLVQALALERSGVRLLGAFEKTGKRGYYTVDVRSTRTDLLKAASLAFAVNLAPEESDFTLLKEEDIRKLLPDGVALTFVDASAEAEDLHGTIGKERELWPILIWMLFAIIGIEFMLSTAGGRKREGDEGPTLSERVVSVSTGAWVGKMTGAPKQGEE
jgi:von Willebrand factor type A domain/Aerotolerance regulator N-terminal